MKRFTVLLFCLGLVAPALAFLLGLRADSFENRAPPQLPPLSGEAVRSGDWFEAMSDTLVFHLPLRHWAVNTIRRIQFGVWQEVATGRVVVGRNDFLFLRNPFNLWCALREINRIARQSGGVQNALVATGRRLIWISVPDKYMVHGEYLPTRFLPIAEFCGRKRQAFSDAMKSKWGESYIDLLPALKRKKEITEHALYHTTDTHWIAEAALLAPERLIDELDGSLWNADVVRTMAGEKRNSDLALKLGLSLPFGSERRISVRPGISLVHSEQLKTGGRHPVRIYQHHSDGQSRLIKGQTLLIYDSFLIPTIDALLPYFEEIVLIHWVDLDQHLFRTYARNADLIIAESIDRLATLRQRTMVNRWWRKILEAD